MERNRLTTEEEATAAFFDRPAEQVVRDITHRVYERGIRAEYWQEGTAKLIQVVTPEGSKTFRIIIAEACPETHATPIWQGKRANEIRELATGDTITYQSRAGEMTFIKTQGADNIALRGLVDIETGQKFGNAKGVTRALGLQVGDIGHVTLVSDNLLRLESR